MVTGHADSRWRKPRLLVELVGLFLVLPFLIWGQWIEVSWILLPLYLVAGYAVVRLWLAPDFHPRRFWWGPSPVRERQALGRILGRFVLVAMVVGLFVWRVYPEHLLTFPRQHTLTWLWVMLLYPLLSVYPQEVLYRAFMFERYRLLFPQPRTLILVSAAAFGGMHIVFGNLPAVWITLIGGYLIADTYARSDSLRLAFLEHTLYGNTVLTLGLGDLFFYGQARQLLH